MSRFDHYLHRSGAGASEIGPPAGTIHTWEDLQRWLDRHPSPMSQPRPKRVPISSPDLERSWKRNLWRRFKAEKGAGAPVGSPPGWEKLVGHRQRVALGLTVTATAGILWLSYLTLRAQQMPEAK